MWTTVGGKLGIGGWFVKRKDKMPKVKAFLDEKVETLQKFQLRKLEWAIKELEKSEEMLTKWKVLEKAGIKERYVVDNYPKIEKILVCHGLSTDLLSSSISNINLTN